MIFIKSCVNKFHCFYFRPRKRLCWRCSQEISSNNKFIVCSQKTCKKKYHRTCVTIDESRELKFSCPWHFCSKCGRRTSAHCSFCSTAFCQGNLKIILMYIRTNCPKISRYPFHHRFFNHFN
jgi:hypothetical protein